MYINFACLQFILFHWLELNSFENFLNEIVKLKEISKQNVYWEIYIINKYIINFLNKTLVHFITEIRSTRQRCSFSIVNPWKSFSSMKGFKEKISYFLCKNDFPHHFLLLHSNLLHEVKWIICNDIFHGRAIQCAISRWNHWRLHHLQKAVKTL